MSNKSSNTLFAHIPEAEYKRLMEIEQKYYNLLAEIEDISEYKDDLEKLRAVEIIVDTRHLKDKKVGLYYENFGWRWCLKGFAKKTL